MSAIVVDTSAWISYFKGKDYPEIDAALEVGLVYLPPVVCAELLSAKMTAKQRVKLQEFLQELPLYEGGFDHWMKVGELRSDLARKGLSMSTPDAHIAQSALDLKAELITEDKFFKKIAPKLNLKLR
ncbi:MAG: PIN domain-containing protein [Bradymonadales bacterium]|nr:MAG: PIN domain-containing protein [Bradymonadales bacterium]